MKVESGPETPGQQKRKRNFHFGSGNFQDSSDGKFLE